MTKKKQIQDKNPTEEFLIYRTDDGQGKLDVRLRDETIWLTQQMMAELFQTTKQNIGQHLKNIFAEGELNQDSVVKNFFTTAPETQMLGIQLCMRNPAGLFFLSKDEHGKLALGQLAKCLSPSIASAVKLKFPRWSSQLQRGLFSSLGLASFILPLTFNYGNSRKANARTNF